MTTDNLAVATEEELAAAHRRENAMDGLDEAVVESAATIGRLRLKPEEADKLDAALIGGNARLNLLDRGTDAVVFYELDAGDVIPVAIIDHHDLRPMPDPFTALFGEDL